MPRFLIVGFLALAAAGMGAAQERGGPPPGRPGPRGGAGRLGLMENPLRQLLAMPPEEREALLERLPPMRQARLRERLRMFDQLPPEERERRLRQLEALGSLPPPMQAVLRRHIQEFNLLPPRRRFAVRREIMRLRRMPEPERRARSASDEFLNAYSTEERAMIADLTDHFPFPESRQPAIPPAQQSR